MTENIHHIFSSSKWEPKNLPVDESLFHCSNGYLGVRGSFEEGYGKGIESIRGCYINGFYDFVPYSYPEKLYGFPDEGERLVKLPDVQTLKLTFDDEPFSLFTGTIESFRRTIDMDKGTVSRIVSWRSPKGKHIDLKFTRLASLKHRNIFWMRCSIKTHSSLTVHVIGGINCNVTNYSNSNDPRVAGNSDRYLVPDSVTFENGLGFSRCHTAKSKLTVDISEKILSGKNDFSTVYSSSKDSIWFGGDIAADADSIISIDKVVSIADSRYFKNGDSQKALEEAISLGFDEIGKEQSTVLKQFWNRSDISIEGDDDLNKSVSFCEYSLFESSGITPRKGGIPAKGLSGEGYEGHYFWDTEIYMFPFFLLTNPDIARSLLDYRYSILDAAKDNARIMGGYRGALYSWRTITGQECSAYFPSGGAQYHINGAVSHAVKSYFNYTKDIEFLENEGIDILVETARFWLDVGHFGNDGRFRLEDVTGPDEYTCLVNNNFYTNLSAQANFRAATQLYKLLKDNGRQKGCDKRTGVTADELRLFDKAADSMLLLYDEKLDINPQDDTFLDKEKWDIADTPEKNLPLLMHYHPLAIYRKQVCKQADALMGYFLYPDAVPIHTQISSYHYYESITINDSTLSACIFSAMSSRLGNPEKGLAYFKQAVNIDLMDKKGNTKDGLHVAALGGVFLDLIYGFGGLEIGDDGIPVFSFNIPHEWDSLSFSILERGSILRIKATHKQASFSLISGNPVDVGLKHHGNFRIHGDKPTIVSLEKNKNEETV